VLLSPETYMAIRTPPASSRIFAPCVLVLTLAAWGLLVFFSAQAMAAGTPGTVQGVGRMGYGAPAPAAPRPNFAGPGDFERGYVGPAPGSDPWNRDADFRARNYQTLHGPQPQFATPPQVGTPSTREFEPAPLPTLPKPPLPGDRDMPATSPSPAPPR